MTRPSDTIVPMLPTHAVILRRVAASAMRDARAAQTAVAKMRSEDNLRAAFRTCLFAARALHRASSEFPDEEDAFIEQAMLMNEIAGGFKLELVRLIEPAQLRR